ncbi:hypothetical protein KKB83_04335 [Patescibacteria group bacterium]|nr:hypothetical protein [Patescibacteria group bacterium]
MKKAEQIYLYKGSSEQRNYFELEPVHETDKERLLQAGVSAEKVVWATNIKKYALPFAAISGQVNWRLHNLSEPAACNIQVDSLDWEEKLDLEKTVYLHFLMPDDFCQVSSWEFIATKKVLVVKSEPFLVRDVLKMFSVYVPVLKKF